MKKFKNDKERIAFLEDYRNKDNGWYLWKHDEDLQRSWWRFDLPDCALIVEEQRLTITWPNTHVIWRVIHWYIVSDWSGNIPFGDFVASRSLALAKIKEIEKREKENKEE